MRTGGLERGLYPLLILLAACGPSKDEQLANCRVAQAAYGDDLGACLVAKYNWSATDASIARLTERARVAALVDSIGRAAEQAESVRLAPARARTAARRTQVTKWLDLFALCVDSLDSAADARPCGRHLHDVTDAEFFHYVTTNRARLTDPDHLSRVQGFLSISYKH